MNESKYEESARAYIESDKTVAETAEYLGIKTRTLQIHFDKVKKTNPELYKLILSKRESQMKKGRIKGGMTGKRSSSHNEEEIKKIAETMIREELTYAEAEEKFGIPKSTIYELVHKTELGSEIISMLDALAEANHRNITTSEYIESMRSKK